MNFSYTIGAWASSYPALWSSIVVAKQGYGDMVACNAIGSNTFCNFVGLGLPWLFVIAISGGAPYSALRDDGVVLTLLMLAVILLISYVLIAISNWKVNARYL